jgi:hypothetical protein
MNRQDWIKELKIMRDDARQQLSALDAGSCLDIGKASGLLMVINELNSSIIAQQEALINELSERKVA